MVSTIAHFSTGVGTVGYSTFVVAIFCFLQRQLLLKEIILRQKNLRSSSLRNKFNRGEMVER